jgi:hypothetical protein
MAVITAAQAGPWSDTATWTGGVVPGAGDTADLNNYVISMDIPVIPAGATADPATWLALIRSGATNNSAGQITVALSENKVINCTTIQAGSVVSPNKGIIYLTGATNTLTINCVVLYANTINAYGLNINITSGTVNFNGNAYGGSGPSAIGIFNGNTTGTLNIVGNVYGGSYTYGTAYGVQCYSASTFNGSIINTTCTAWAGKTPANWSTAPVGAEKARFVQFGGTSGPKLGPEPAAGEMLSGVVCGSTVGTYLPPLSIDPGVSNVFAGVEYVIYGIVKVGAFDEAARNMDPGVANVLAGVDYVYMGDVRHGAFDEAARNIDPGAVNVWSGIPYKIAGVDKIGAKRASSIPNCEAGNIKAGIEVDNVLGTYDPVTGQFTDPGIANVLNTATYKFAGADLTGTFAGTDSPWELNGTITGGVALVDGGVPFAPNYTEEAIYSLLTSDDSVSALVEARVYPVYIPQGKALPAIAYQQISAQRSHDFDGDETFTKARFQITCLSETHAGAIQIAKAIRDLLAGYSGTVAGIKIQHAMLLSEGDIPYIDPEQEKLRRYGKRLDFEFQYNDV